MKFTFPLPGRRQRPAPMAAPEPDLPRSNKASQILGSTGINVDAPKQWDAASSSGISISVTESTATHHTGERGHYPRSDQGSRAGSRWEQESDTVPAHLKQGPSRLPADTVDNSDVSTMARRPSNSTIRSYYDKSRVPLSISQQTSSSAMAKGLPTKASSLLDIGGTMSPPNKRRSKATKLDISHLLRPSSAKSQTSLGNEYSVKSPSVLSLSPVSSRATLSPVKMEHTVVRKSTRERLHELAGRATRRAPIAEVPVSVPAPRHNARDAVDLHHLYEHYEQMSFRQVMEPDFDGSTPLEPVSEMSTEDHAQPPAQSPISTQHPISNINPHYDPEKPVITTKTAPIYDPDYATSISSRHTRTSKGSKRTTQSFLESDLLQTSVLSLSSDSEDDGFTEQRSAHTTASARGRSGSGVSQPTSSIAEKRQSTASKSSGKSGKRASFAPKSTYLTIPHDLSTPPRQQDIARRTSSLRQTQSPTTSSLRSSRLSAMSSSTTNSSSSLKPISEVAPSAAAPNHSSAEARVPSELPLLRPSASIQSDQPTPPLSPNSADFYVRPPEDEDSASRLMSVTRQEEMLLSALRMKRAKMRESPGPEPEASLPPQQPLPSLPLPTPPQQPRRQASNGALADGAYSAPVRAIKKSGSKSSMGTPARTATPNLAARPEQPHSTRTRSPLPERTTSPAASRNQLLYLDQSDSTSDSEEPSPDLSDFMDFDQSSEGTADRLSFGPNDADGHPDHHRLTGDETPATPVSGLPAPTTLSPKLEGLAAPVCVVREDDRSTEGEDEDDVGIPRPDSPISPQFPIFPMPSRLRKGVRLSAVGHAKWDDEG